MIFGFLGIEQYFQNINKIKNNISKYCILYCNFFFRFVKIVAPSKINHISHTHIEEFYKKVYCQQSYKSQYKQYLNILRTS